MNAFVFLAVTAALALVGVNSVCALAAYRMAKTRGLAPLPVFFAVLLGSLPALCFVAMFPVKPPAWPAGEEGEGAGG